MESKITQYRQAAEGVRQQLHGVSEIDPAAPALAAKLALAPLVVAVGRKALEAVRPLAKQPVVFCMVLGVAASDLTRNISGVPMAPDPRQALAALHALAPKARKVGYIHDTDDHDLITDRASAVAATLGLELVEWPVKDGAEAMVAFDSLLGSIDALYLPPSPQLFGSELLSYLLTAAAEHKLPVIGFLDSITQSGALAAVSPSYGDIGAQAGKLAAEILRRPEAKRLPVPPVVYAVGRLSLNLKTARVLGLVVPPRLLSTAGEVY